MMTGEHGRPAGRPRVRILDRAVITAAALAIVEEGGVSALTMTRLANRVQVTPSALYNHVSSKQEILRWLEDHFMSQIDVSGFDHHDWAAGLRTWAFSYRGVMATQTDLIPAIATIEIADSPRTVAMYERVTTALVSAGWPIDRCVPLIVAIEAFVYGAAFNERAPESIFDVGALDQIAPTFVRAVAASYGRGARGINDEVFADGLDALIRDHAERAGVPLPA